MVKRVGMLTVLDQGIVDWLETHHIRGRDVYEWSADGKIGDITRLTISLYVSGVDEIPPGVSISLPGNITADEAAEFVRRFMEFKDKPGIKL